MLSIGASLWYCGTSIWGYEEKLKLHPLTLGCLDISRTLKTICLHNRQGHWGAGHSILPHGTQMGQFSLLARAASPPLSLQCVWGDLPKFHLPVWNLFMCRKPSQFFLSFLISKTMIRWVIPLELTFCFLVDFASVAETGTFSICNRFSLILFTTLSFQNHRPQHISS